MKKNLMLAAMLVAAGCVFAQLLMFPVEYIGKRTATEFAKMRDLAYSNAEYLGHRPVQKLPDIVLEDVDYALSSNRVEVGDVFSLILEYPGQKYIYGITVRFTNATTRAYTYYASVSSYR